MIRRLLSVLIPLLLVCSMSWANAEYNITLERDDAKGQTIELPYGNISFRYLEYGNYNKVLAVLENTTPTESILIFKNARSEKELKSQKPKVEFEKTYPGSKGKRSVYGCKDLKDQFVPVIPQEKLEFPGINVSTTTTNRIELPIYLAKYNPKKLVKKGPYDINYKILSEDIVVFNIDIKGWSEKDSDYVTTKAAVEDLIKSINSATFCKNKKHKPSLAKQIRPYQNRKDSLLNAIRNTIQSHREWMSTDKPHIKYTELYTQLQNVNLNSRAGDCGEHKGRTPKGHSCSYCSLSAQQVYHQLDDIYQQLRAGRMSKDAAVSRSNALNACYQKSTRRKKDSGYTAKISKFYSRIINY